MIHELAQNVKKNVAKVIVGKDDIIELVLTAVLAKGHVLLEDVPGTGKTVMAKSLSRSIDCEFKRIQFTPDLLPSDVTGLSVFNQQKITFEFKKGAIFAGVVLADEINRATPRTQSALLECMEERQVTVDGNTYPLPAPFIVVATQNPVEIQGTFPLPEAQLDRFMVRLRMGYPDTDGSIGILSRFINDDPLEELAPVVSAQQIVEAQEEIKKVHVSPAIMEYIVSLCENSRKMEQVTLGVSPRGALALMRASQAYAALQNRDYATPDDVKKLAVPVMAHRVIVRGAYGRADKSEEVIAQILRQTPVPTEAPL
ncbi:MAG: AAA family ATPase [Christensenellales bacterium]